MRLVGGAAVARAHTPTRDRPRRRRADRLDAMDSEFWGCVIPAGRAVRVEVATDEEYVHVSQAALGADAREAGRTTGDARGGGRRRGERREGRGATRAVRADARRVRSGWDGRGAGRELRAASDGDRTTCT